MSDVANDYRYSPSEPMMQVIAAQTSAANAIDRDHAWLRIAARHWSARATTADEFAMQAVGRVLLEDLATAPTTRCG
jgi:hypothetical protein